MSLTPRALTLYHYWRSSCSWRVRWALDHYGIPYTPVAVSLLNDETDTPEFRKLNPAGYVPALVFREFAGVRDCTLSESLPILELLTEWAQKNLSALSLRSDARLLLPQDPWERAQVRRLAETINAGTQPLQNLVVLDAISREEAKRKAWSQQWIARGLTVYESLLAEGSGNYSVGDQISIADLCLAPQLYNARRVDLDLSVYPRCLEIEKALQNDAGFQNSHPDRFTN